MFRTFVLIIVVIATALMSQSALAVIRSNTIDPDATLRTHGRQVVVTGPIACDEGDRLLIQITATQASSGAWGEGHTHLKCTGDVQRWSVTVVARGATTFESGHAEACAVGITRHRGTTTDTRQWCAASGVTLSA